MHTEACTTSFGAQCPGSQGQKQVAPGLSMCKGHIEGCKERTLVSLRITRLQLRYTDKSFLFFFFFVGEGEVLLKRALESQHFMGATVHDSQLQASQLSYSVGHLLVRYQF